MFLNSKIYRAIVQKEFSKTSNKNLPNVLRMDRNEQTRQCLPQSTFHDSLFWNDVLIYQKLWSVTLFTISICCSRKKGFGHLFTFIIKALSYTYVPSRLALFTHSVSIVWNRKTQRSLVRGRGTSIVLSKTRIRCLVGGGSRPENRKQSGQWFF